MREGACSPFNAAARDDRACHTSAASPLSLVLRVPELVEAIARCAMRPASAERVEFFERVPAERWFEAFVRPVGDAPPAALMLMTFHDLTPLRRVEEMRADFVANASHELRTPLAALPGFIDTLQGSGPRRCGGARAVSRHHAGAGLADGAADRRSAVAVAHRAQRASAAATRRSISLPIVRQVVDGLQTLARDRGVEIEVDEPAEPLVVLGDRDELIRVFENLVENALKYGRRGKRVEIGFARRPQRTASARRTSRCAITARASPPSICRA